MNPSIKIQYKLKEEVYKYLHTAFLSPDKPIMLGMSGGFNWTTGIEGHDVSIPHGDVNDDPTEDDIRLGLRIEGVSYWFNPL